MTISAYLFVGGPARSGTTAFTKLFNSHPQIALGLERYKFLYTRHREEVGPQLFESKRFLQFDPSETNIAASQLGDLEKFGNKLDLARYRGDKIPQVMRYQKLFDERFPQCKFIIMCRDVHSICSSWNVRAQNPKDHWPDSNDFRVAVDHVNKELTRAVEYQSKQPERCLIVRYENIFGAQGPQTAAKILDWLEINHHPRLFAAVEKNMAVASRINGKPIVEYDGQREYIQKHIDWSVIERVEAVAV